MSIHMSMHRYAMFELGPSVLRIVDVHQGLGMAYHVFSCLSREVV